MWSTQANNPTTMNNSFGDIYRLTTFGESHGPAIGGVVDGMPAGVAVDLDALRRAMERRRPSASLAGATGRREADEVTLLSGVFNGVTTGTPIGFTIANSDMRSGDYDELRDVYRPSHADYTYALKYGADARDYRGGGRASARETACRVVAGELARQALARTGIEVSAFTLAIGGESIAFPESAIPRELAAASENPVRCPDHEAAARMAALIDGARAAGDTLGGVVGCIASGIPAGLGDPVYGKFQARLASAMLSINAAHGFDYGLGFDGAACSGSSMADLFAPDGHGGATLLSNHSGGIQGGITNGMPVWFRVAFKPVATMMREFATVDTAGRSVVVTPRGRHDVCVVPRAVAVVEAMTWMVIMDCWLKARINRPIDL